MNLVSFSLFGDKPKYLVGAIRNAEDVPKFYPDFRSIFYCDDDVPEATVEGLSARGALIERRMRHWPRITMIERHMVVLVRDVDSRISDREARAVAAWLESGKNFHCMRDFPFHTNRVMGGMWGVRLPARLIIRRAFHRWCNGRYFPKSEWFGIDQKFLAEAVWPQIANSALQHDSFHMFPDSVDFPMPALADGSFVGEIWDEHERPVQSDRDVCFEARKKL